MLSHIVTLSPTKEDIDTLELDEEIDSLDLLTDLLEELILDTLVDSELLLIDIDELFELAELRD